MKGDTTPMCGDFEKTFQTFAFCDVKVRAVVAPSVQPEDGIVVDVGRADLTGRLVLRLAPNFSQDVTRAYLGADDVSAAMVRDVVGELANVLTGRAWAFISPGIRPTQLTSPQSAHVEWTLRNDDLLGFDLLVDEVPVGCITLQIQNL